MTSTIDQAAVNGDFESVRRSSEFEALIAASVRMGSNPMLVQAAGGNFSLKRNDCMWIKASGTWLAEAAQKDIMVPVDSKTIATLLTGSPAPLSDLMDFVPAAVNRSQLRPSVETSVHAVIPWPVVLHTHAVEVIAAAVCREWQSILDSLIGAMDPVYVPYVKPGTDLARTLSQCAEPGRKVFVLGNHGLVCAGETVAEAERLTQEVAQKIGVGLRVPQGQGQPTARFVTALEGTDWMPVPHVETQQIAFDMKLCDIARSGTLYPDHIVFLGPGVGFMDEPEQLAGRVADTGGIEPKLIVVPNEGVAMPADASRSMLALARAFGDIVTRIPDGKEVAVLTKDQEAELLNWDAEKYRLSIGQ
ncbi:MAG: class II aldolase/adducin family protein [Hyphomicrobiales bacterium]|nr:class II aldolase/adducin family protein [Hyphomicrobiales bacterium]MCY4032988.1 class II aldolase/adducin family protein [Hyphomicrobiales bacterium]